MQPVIGWRPVAAYIYLLNLDGPGLAWEYLRRNSRYLESWTHKRSSPRAKYWGLRWLEDPSLDARVAQPAWIDDPVNQTRLTADSQPTANRFSIWKLPGRKRLAHDGARLLITGRAGGRKLRIALEDNVHEGSPYAYLVSAKDPTPMRWWAIEQQRELIAQGSWGASLAAPDRIALMHMRSIQALDGRRAGASQRVIAEALFGVEVVAQRWMQDGELRAQVRHLLRRGEEHLQQQYLQLLANG
jgi:hypothetical protein